MAAYYNEFERGAAEWLRWLIKEGHIADGEVDERSILDVQPVDLAGFTQCHFFAGIGGWSYALRLAGWPDDRPVWTGSPPCQPFSVAGANLGRDDERHLAPHFVSLVRACRPPVLFGEQVASAAVFGKAAKRAGGTASGAPEWAWIDDLSDRLEAARYAVGTSDIPAASVGAPHIRQRTFFGAVRVEYTSGDGWNERRAEPRGRSIASGRGDEWMADADNARPQGRLGMPECPSECAPGSGSVVDRLADAKCDRQHRGWDIWQNWRHELADGSCEPGWPRAPDNLWRDADWLFCRDGKWRPVESSLFRLADGLPSDLGIAGMAGLPKDARFPLAEGVKHRAPLLRGFGNAIVPQAAAKFVESFMEAKNAIR